jgi:hypothetical protein
MLQPNGASGSPDPDMQFSEEVLVQNFLCAA